MGKQPPLLRACRAWFVVRVARSDGTEERKGRSMDDENDYDEMEVERPIVGIRGVETVELVLLARRECTKYGGHTHIVALLGSMPVELRLGWS